MKISPSLCSVCLTYNLPYQTHVKNFVRPEQYGVLSIFKQGKGLQAEKNFVWDFVKK